MKYRTIFAALIVGIVLASQALPQKPSGPPQTVAAVDLKRYVGKWYEIARFPNKFQKHCVGNTTATYSAKASGRLEVVNQCLKQDGTDDIAKGEARIVDTRTNAKLKVRFAPKALSFLSFVWGDYWVLELGPDYEYAAVGDPKREYLWILSRKPEMDAAQYQNILRRLESKGFDPARLQKTSQKVESLKGTAVDKSS
jgi:apolipoprotein D and lipocalin family protein